MKRSALPLAAAIAALALVAAAGAIAARREGDAELSPIPSVENGGPRGLAVARAWLAATGRPHRVIRPGDAGPVQGEIALLVAPPQRLGEADVAELARHAERGGLVVLAVGESSQPALEARLGIARAGAPSARPEHRSRALAPHPLFDGLELRTRGGALRTRAPGSPPALPVAGDAERATALAVPFGAGEAIVLAAPDTLENAGLGVGDHLALLSRLAGLGPIAFDERHLPSPSAPSATRRTVAPLLGQALLVAVVLLLALGRRLGAVRVAVDGGGGQTSADYLASLADLYRRAGAERELGEEAWRILRKALELRAGVPARLPDVEAHARLDASHPAAGAALRRAAAGRDAGSLLATTRASAEVEALLTRKGPDHGH